MPNNGTKIYTQTINGVTYGIDVEHDVYKVLGIGPINGFYDIAYACNNTHGKICRYSAMKPYRFGSFSSIDRDIAKANNFGMTPVLLLYAQSGDHRLDSTPWGQWQPPQVNVHFSRIDDFDGYNHLAHKHVAAVRIHNSISDDDTTPILGSTGGNSALKGKLIGELETRPTDSTMIRLHEFKYNGTESIASWRLTLVFGPFVQDSFETAWVVQGPRADEMVDGLFTVEMETTDSDHMLNLVEEFGYGHSLTVLCLAPEIPGATRGIVSEIPNQMLSLNMWSDDNFRQIIYNEKYAQPAPPKPEHYVPVMGDYFEPYQDVDFTWDNSQRRLGISFNDGSYVQLIDEGNGYAGNLKTGYLNIAMIISDRNGDYPVKEIRLAEFGFSNLRGSLPSGEVVHVSYDDIERAAVSGLPSGQGPFTVQVFLTVTGETLYAQSKTLFYLSADGSHDDVYDLAGEQGLELDDGIYFDRMILQNQTIKF